MFTNECGLNLFGALGADGLLSMAGACGAGRALAFGGDGAHLVFGGSSRLTHLGKLNGSMVAPWMSRKLRSAAITAGLGGGRAHQAKDGAKR